MEHKPSKTIVETVEAYCQEKGIRFTEPRRMVLEAMAEARKPVGAYDILAQMGKKVANPKPPTVYRAIDFLLEHQIIHRIESLNAYILCQSDHSHNGSQFMICDTCGSVSEAHLCDLPAALSDKTREEGFQLSRWNVELHGTCKACTTQQDRHAHVHCGCAH